MLAPTGTIGKIRADSALLPYVGIFFEFQEYISRTQLLKFHAHGCVNGDPNATFDLKPMEYAHRFTPTYQKGQIASFYQLEAWMRENPRQITLLTLTAYQRGAHSIKMMGHAVSIAEAFEILKHSWRLLTKILRKALPGLDYILVTEPHKSGYPHFHVFLLTHELIPKKLQKKIAHLWQTKYKAGSADKGVEFTFSTADSPISNIRNYLLKYTCKSYYSAISKFPETDKRNEMTAGRYVFYALAWKNHWRLIQKSNRLSKIMKCQKKEHLVEDDNGEMMPIEYTAVEISRPVAGAHNQSELREYTTMWIKKGAEFRHWYPEKCEIKPI